MEAKVTTNNIIVEGMQYCRDNKINMSRFINQCLISLINGDICYQPDFDPIKNRINNKNVLKRGHMPSHIKSVLNTMQAFSDFVNNEGKGLYNISKNFNTQIKELENKYIMLLIISLLDILYFLDKDLFIIILNNFVIFN